MPDTAPVTRDKIGHGLRQLGLRPGDNLLVHSSLKSFGRVDGGADTVIDGILDVLGGRGTLLAPTLTGGPEYGPDNPPHIDLRTASCWTGALPETLRQRPAAIRSTHPTHSVAALGAHADTLTLDHHLSPTPCSYTSPYQRLLRAGGKIAFFGCGLCVCTTFHAIESIACVEYHLQKAITYASCIDQHSNRIETPCRLHDYHSPEREFPVMQPILIKKGAMRVGTIGKATVRMVDTTALLDITLDALRFDPWYLTVNRGRRDIMPWR
ncbi:MAG: aminoglycoside N(3)-acetyltransferase [Candidatus Hydrogenedentota bacterium]